MYTQMIALGLLPLVCIVALLLLRRRSKTLLEELRRQREADEALLAGQVQSNIDSYGWKN